MLIATRVILSAQREESRYFFYLLPYTGQSFFILLFQGISGAKTTLFFTPSYAFLWTLFRALLCHYRSLKLLSLQPQKAYPKPQIHAFFSSLLSF
jgi:hypothetical protein